MQQATALSSESDENLIRQTAAAWSAAAGSRDLNKCVSFYTDDASVLPFNAPIAVGKDQIRNVWSQLMSIPASVLPSARRRLKSRNPGT